MSYQAYHSIEHTHGDGYTSTSSMSVVIHELSEAEVAELPSALLKTRNECEIQDEDRLTEHDFFNLMNSEDDESEAESDVEYYWFPSLLHRSFIHFLDDEQDDQVMADEVVTNAEVDEEGWEDIEDEENKPSNYKSRHKVQHRHRSRRCNHSEQIPVEVIHIHF
ncbi:hypothetical protein K501DRAFT_286606 [Backusella circina FSU 941]|nr:hypothetical protein K501DRAFT_286606 [Backusella circina FSU 941]